MSAWIWGAAAAALGLVSAGLWFFRAPMPPDTSPPGDERTLMLGGRSRHFIVDASAARRQTAAPVLLVFHGSLMNGAQMRRMLGGAFQRMAQRTGAIVVYPSGVEGHFNDGRLTASYSARTLNIDDVAFAQAILDGLASESLIDRERVYAFGYSNGGHMAMRLAAERPDGVKGIVVANAQVPTPDWALAEPQTGASTKVVLIEGTRDPISPYGGGRVTIFGFGDRGTVLSAPASARWFARRMGLRVEPGVDKRWQVGGLTVRQQDWGEPPQVRLLTQQGAGHTVPQSAYRFPRFLGATVQDDALLDEAWRMLEGR